MPVRPNPIHILSLGAGVQSSTLALMATLGKVSPMPSYAVFADTHAEPPEVYSWLDRLEKLLAFPVVRVSEGNLREAALTVEHALKSDATYLRRMLPVFYNNNGNRGMAQRRCTINFKIKPIRQFSHRHMHRGVVQWLGISTDEAGRMRDSEVGYIQNRYPLIEAGMSREDCLQWMRDHKYPEPPKSSCVFCPFKSDEQWRRLKTEMPDEFAKVAAFERELQNAQIIHEEQPFVGFFHSSLVNIDQAQFNAKSRKTGFMNDCSGSCGV